MASRGLGRRYAPDPRDDQHRMGVFLHRALAALPSKRFWRTGPVLDQGETNECVGHAWKGWSAAAPLMVRDPHPDQHEWYRGARDHDEWPGTDYEGTSVRGGAKFGQLQGRISRYVWTKTGDEVAGWVLQYGPVVIGTDWKATMFEPNASGLVVPRGAVEGGHAYLCVGYDRSRRLFRFVNSWGRGWGQEGRFWMDHDEFDRLLSDQGEACAAIEQLPVTA